MCTQSLSHVPLFVTPWTVVHQAPLFMEFSRQKYWNWLPFSSPEDLPNTEIKPQSPTLQADSLPSEAPTILKTHTHTHTHTHTLLLFIRIFGVGFLGHKSAFSPGFLSPEYSSLSFLTNTYLLSIGFQEVSS